MADEDRYLTGSGEFDPERGSGSYNTNTAIGPFSGGAILSGQEDATPIVGGRFTTQLPEGLSATLSRTGQAGAPMEYARDAIRLAKQLEAGQLALEAARVGERGLPSYGLQYSGQIGKQGGAKPYYPPATGNWYVDAGGTPGTPERHIMFGAKGRFADGGEVDAALHTVRQHFDEGGFLDSLRNYFSSDGDYQSAGGKLIKDNGEVNWGDPESAADFFRADKARMALDKRPAVGRPEDDVTGSMPAPPRRPAPEAPEVKIPFEAPKAGFELPEQAKPEGGAAFPYTGFRAVPPGFAMPSPVAPDLPAPRAAPDVRPMAYAPATGAAQAPALQAINAATSPLDIRDISHLSEYRGSAMETPQAVVFHHTAGEGTPEGVVNTLNTRKDPFTGRPMTLGVHYIIDRDGSIHSALPPGSRGAHIMPSKINDLSNYNTYGVEVIAKDNNDITPEQIAAGQRLYTHLSAGRSEPLGVFGHGELNPGHKLPDEGLAIVNPIRTAAAPVSATDAAVDTARKVTNRAVNYPELSADDKDLIAKTIAAEASGKSPEEAHAIANVILNRAIAGGRYGKSIRDILFAENQFEPWSSESKANYPMKFKPGMPAYDAGAAALQKAYDAGDITGGSTYFWAPKAQGELGRDVPGFARKYPGFNIGATRFHRETREDGGEVEGYGDGGIIKKALGVLAGSAPSKVVTDPAERAANLAKMMSRSAIKNTQTNDPIRLYHVTTQPNLEALKAGGIDPTISGEATWLSPYPDKQPAWHNVGGGSGYREGANVMPVYADIQTPLVMDTPEMIDWAQTAFAGGSREFPQFMHPDWRKALIDEGYDGIVYGGPKSKEYALHDLQIGQQPHRDEEILSLFPERQLKSAIGNGGEYDMEVPRLSEASGGEVEGYAGGGDVVKQALNAIRGWHGSGKQFKQFDASKMGSGVGELFGRGVYVTDTPDFARTYRDMGVRAKPDQKIGGRPASELYDFLQKQADSLPPEQAQPVYNKIKILEDLMFKGDPLAVRDVAKYGIYDPEAMNWFEGQVVPKLKTPGGLYEVEIKAKPEQFLQWQKPFGEQSPFIQDALRPNAVEMADKANQARAQMLERGIDYRRRPFTPERIEELRKISTPEDIGGLNLYGAIHRDYGSVNPHEWQPEANQFLRDKGVVGNAYRDKGGQGDIQNYVVYDPADTEILNRYAHGGEVDDALRVVREHHADGEAVGQAPFFTFEPTPDSVDRQAARQPAYNPAERTWSDAGSTEGERLTRALGVEGELPKGETFMSAAPTGWDKYMPQRRPGSYLKRWGEAFDENAKDVREGYQALKEGNYGAGALGMLGGVMGAGMSPLTGMERVLVRDPVLQYTGDLKKAQQAETVADIMATGGVGGMLKPFTKAGSLEKLIAEPLTSTHRLPSPAATGAATTAAATLAPEDAEAGNVDRILRGLRAYHGSPYKFDRFDLSKIGTGEGAQSFGHGLYFAENEGVAKNYRDMLAHKGTIDLEQAARERDLPLSRDAQMEIRRQASGDADPSQAAQWAQYASSEMRPYDREKIADLIDAYRQSRTGHMYEVNIDAHPNQLLDWDKPLAAQSGDVKKALSKFDLVRANNEAQTNYNDALYRALTSEPNIHLPEPPRDYTGSQIHNALRENLHLTRQPPAPFLRSSADLSSEMNRHGVAGIKYLDKGSRDLNGNLTHNYVIFNDKLIDINRRYAEGGQIPEGNDMRDHFESGGLKLVNKLANKRAKIGHNGGPSLPKVFPEVAERYPLTKEPVEAFDKNKGKYYLAKDLTPEALAIQKARKAALASVAKGDYVPFFDPAQRFDVDPTKYPNYTPTTSVLTKQPATQAKYDAIAGSPEASTRLDEAYARGLQQQKAAENWYFMGQLEQEFIKEYGPDLGRQMFKQRFADPMAATTGGADPTSNLMMAHYGNYLKEQGLPIPEHSYEYPFPIGGRFAGENMKQYDKMIMQGQGITHDNPKRYNFSYDFMGKKGPTIDEQMSQMFDPKMNMPPAGTYGHYENALANRAANAGVDPRYFQEVAWAGKKDADSKAGFKAQPMIGIVNEAIERTHQITGMPRDEIVRRGLVRAEIPLYGAAGATAAGAMGPEFMQGQGEAPAPEAAEAPMTEERKRGGSIVDRALMLVSR